MAVHVLETMTIRNKTGKPFEFMWDHQLYYLDKDQEWSLDRGVAQILVNKHFDQLEVVDEGQSPTFPPVDDPNVAKTYAEMHPKQYRSRMEGKPWCVTCGKLFKSGGQLMMHRKKHEKEQRAAKKQEEADEVEEAKEPVEA